MQEVQKLHGLTTEEAQKRLKEYGPNAIEEKEESWWHRFFRRFWGPIPWMIEVAGNQGSIIEFSKR